MLNEFGRIGIGKAVAVVEDDGEMRSMLVDYLSAAGFEVHAYTCAVEFLKVAAKSKGYFSFVLSDVHMNGSNGLKMLEELRKYDLELPVYLMTAAPTFKDELNAKNCGAQGYLKKPFSMSEFLKRIRANLPPSAA